MQIIGMVFGIVGMSMRITGFVFAVISMQKVAKLEQHLKDADVLK